MNKYIYGDNKWIRFVKKIVVCDNGIKGGLYNIGLEEKAC